jgi:hypothetical protein
MSPVCWPVGLQQSPRAWPHKSLEAVDKLIPVETRLGATVTLAQAAGYPALPDPVPFREFCSWYRVSNRLSVRKSLHIKVTEGVESPADMHLMALTVDLTDAVVVATAAGRVTLSDAISIFTKACDVAAERGFDRVLVDCLSVEGELSTMERYELGRTVAEHCSSRSMTPKVATVGNPPVIDGFAARVASNRGIVAETFSEMQKAMGWLKGFGSKAAGHQIG